jgi:hypothetical protein
MVVVPVLTGQISQRPASKVVGSPFKRIRLARHVHCVLEVRNLMRVEGRRRHHKEERISSLQSASSNDANG